MKKALAFLILTSILLRLWVALGYWSEKPLTQDAKEYLELANSYHKTGTFRYEKHETLQIESYERAPGYPFWLAICLGIQPNLSWIRIVEVLVNMLSTYLFFLLGREMFGFRPGISAFLVATFYLPFLVLIPPILSENLWILVMLVSYWFLVRTRTRAAYQASLHWIAAVIFLATATLIRPGTVFLLPFFGYWYYRCSGWKPVALGFLLYFAVLLPWNLHLYGKEGRFVFVASEGGVTFWTGTHPQYSGDGDLASNPPVQQDYRAILRSHAGKSPSSKEPLFFAEGVSHILENPGTYAMLEAKKLLFGFLPVGASVMKTSMIHRATGIGFYAVLLILALMGVKSAPQEPRLLLAGVAISYAVMILLFIPQERFRIAMLDPMLMLFAASTISRRFKNI